MKNLNKYTEAHSVDMDDFFDELNQDANYREGVEDEKDKLTSAIAIFEARKAAGLSQCELAEESVIPKTTIARALGKRVRVSLS